MCIRRRLEFDAVIRQRHELETYRHERGILTYKLETEYFDPLHQLERLCESVVAARDFAPAFVS